MLGFLLKFPYGKTEHLGKNAHAMTASGNMHPRFADFIETDARNNSSPKVPAVESNLET